MLGRSSPDDPHTARTTTYDRKSTNRKDALPPWSVASLVLGVDSSIHSRPYRCTQPALAGLYGDNPTPPRRSRFCVREQHKGTSTLQVLLGPPTRFALCLRRTPFSLSQRRVLRPSAAPPARGTHHVTPPDGPGRGVGVAPSRRPLGRCACRRDGCACLPRQRHRPL